MTLDLTPLLQALIGIAVTLITSLLIPWIKAKTNAQQRANLKAAYRIVALAAEQLYGANHGDEKLQYALDRLREMGIVIDRTLLEATVMELFNWNFMEEQIDDDNAD